MDKNKKIDLFGEVLIPKSISPESIKELIAPSKEKKPVKAKKRKYTEEDIKAAGSSIGQMKNNVVSENEKDAKPVFVKMPNASPKKSDSLNKPKTNKAKRKKCKKQNGSIFSSIISILIIALLLGCGIFLYEALDKEEEAIYPNPTVGSFANGLEDIEHSIRTYRFAVNHTPLIDDNFKDKTDLSGISSMHFDSNLKASVIIGDTSYHIFEDTIYCNEINGDKVSELFRIDTSEKDGKFRNGLGLTVFGNRLVALFETKEALTSENPDRKYFEILVYEIDDNTPFLLSSFSQEGENPKSFVKDGILYFTTEYTGDINITNDFGKLIPSVSHNGVESQIEYENVFLPNFLKTENQLIISCISFEENKEAFTAYSYLGYEGQVIFTDLGIFIPENFVSKTGLTLFEFKNGGLSLSDFYSLNGAVFSKESIYFDGQTLNVLSYFNNVLYFNEITSTGISEKSIVYIANDLKGIGLSVDGNTFGYVLNQGNLACFDLNELSLVSTQNADFLAKLHISSTNGFVVSSTEESGITYLNGYVKQSNGKFEITFNESLERIENINADEIYIDAINKVICIPHSKYNGFDQTNEYFIYVFDESTGFKGVGDFTKDSFSSYGILSIELLENATVIYTGDKLSVFLK